MAADRAVATWRKVDDDDRAALQGRLPHRARGRDQGREAKNASFSQAWANGELKREHFARWAENHYHYVGPFADYLGYIYANTPDHATDAKDFLLQNMYEEELSDVRHTDLLIRFAEACGTTRERVMDPDNMTAVTRGLQGWCYAIGDPRALRRRHRRARGRPRVAGAVDLPPAVPGAAREVRLHRGGGRVLRPAHHLRRDPRRARLPDRARVRRHARAAAALPRSSSAHGAEMRFSYTKALYDTYVAPDLGTGRQARAGARLTAEPRHGRCRRSGSTPADREVEFPEGDEVNLLRVAIRNDCGVPFKCASGNCGTDRVRVRRGRREPEPVRASASASGSASCVDRGLPAGCQTYVMR